MTDVGAPAPEVFRLSMEKLPLAVARARRVASVELLAVATALIALVELALGGSEAGVDLALTLMILVVVALPYVGWRVRLRVRRRWNAFELSIGPTNMRCAARGSGRVTIPLAAITSITEDAGGLVVSAAEPELVIRVPTFVEGFVDVRARLAARHPIAARADAALWCAALLGVGVLTAATASFWGRFGCVALGIVATQAVAAVSVGAELRWHPCLPRASKRLCFGVVAVAAALPLGALLVAA